ELYLSAIVDRTAQSITVIASNAGGIDIEEIAKHSPDRIFTITLDPLTGPQPFQGRQLAYQLQLPPAQINQFSQLVVQIYQLVIENDLNLVEINPLVITTEATFCCLDAKISVDNNALFRQPHLSALFDISQEEPLEAQAADN